MSKITGIRTPTGAWLSLDRLTEAELRAYVRDLANELTTGVQVLEALIAYGRCRWPDGEEWHNVQSERLPAGLESDPGKNHRSRGQPL